MKSPKMIGCVVKLSASTFWVQDSNILYRDRSKHILSNQLPIYSWFFKSFFKGYFRYSICLLCILGCSNMMEKRIQQFKLLTTQKSLLSISKHSVKVLLNVYRELLFIITQQIKTLTSPKCLLAISASIVWKYFLSSLLMSRSWNTRIDS